MAKVIILGHVPSKLLFQINRIGKGREALICPHFVNRLGSSVKTNSHGDLIKVRIVSASYRGMFSIQTIKEKER